MHGQGAVLDSSGAVIKKGYWVSGEYAGPTPPPGYKPSENQAVAVPRSPAPAPTPPSYSASKSRIAMVQDGGIFKVPIMLNGVLTLQFIVDSGASDVSIPADVVMTLIRTGTLKDEDFLGEQQYRLADGSVIKSKTFRIRSLKVGNRTVQNVQGSVADVQGALLLGQSFLKTFKSWTMDNAKHELVLE